MRSTGKLMSFAIMAAGALAAIGMDGAMAATPAGGAKAPVKMMWSSGWSDAEYVVNGMLYSDDNEVDDSALFTARCEPGKRNINLWFFVDHARFPGQTVDKIGGLRGPYRYRSAAVLVDGTAYDLKGARLTPEESSGGHELSIETPRDTPLVAVLRNGKTFSVRVDDFTMPALSLKGATKAFDTFAQNCARPRR